MEMHLLVITSILHLLDLVSADLQYVVSENIPPQILGNVRIDANLNLPQTGISFTILPEASGFGQKLFTVDTNGDFRTLESIDRDVICPQMALCVMHLDIRVNPTQYFEIVKIKVTVSDINDQKPVFDKSIYTISLSEAALVGTEVPLPLAKDLDSPVNGIRNYYSNNLDTSVFSFPSVSQTNGDPKIITQKNLDRETTPVYQFLLFASDSASPANSGSALIRIELLDVNDSPPVFNKSLYEVTLNENTAINSSILQLSASDKDLGQNAQVLYFLSSETLATYGDLFTLNQYTGVLYVTGVLDYEVLNEAVITVIARNLEETSPSSSVKIIVTVRDLNDVSPKIKLNTPTQNGGLSVMENATLGTFVAHITVEDPDTGPGGLFKCTLPRPATGEFSLIEIYATDFKIITSAIFDREKVSNYTVTIGCSDKGSNSLTSTQNIPITITDVNDNSPVFNNNTYKVIIAENDAPGSVILKVKATDKDLDENGRVTYALTSNNTNSLTTKKHVDINPTTGEISATRAFDYEEMHTFSFSVSAVDHGIPPRSSECTVVIQVLDRDDEFPVFIQDVYEFKISENNKIGDYLDQVVANDNDSSIYSVVTYWFVLNEYSLDDTALAETDGVFIISPDTGAIHVNESLDREMTSQYTLHVMARGPGPLYRNSTCDVIVDVIDENDNNPQFLFPNNENYTVLAPMALKPNDVITRIEAIDLDQKENALLSYQLISGDSDGIFKLDKVTGNLYAVKHFTAVKDYKIQLLLLVTDGGMPNKSASAYLQVDFVLNIIPATLESAPGKNSDILIIIGVLSGVLVVVLLTAIVCLLMRTRQLPVKHKQLQSSANGVQSKSRVKLTVVDVGETSRGDVQVPPEPEVTGKGPHTSQTKEIDCTPGTVNIGLDMDNDSIEKEPLDQIDLDSGQPSASGGGVKDESSECNNSDSGRGSNEESSSLPGGSLQRWSNIQLSTGKESEISMPDILDGPHADPEGRRNGSLSFRSDSSIPPALPPRTHRISQSLRMPGDLSNHPPPPPPPREPNKTRRVLFKMPETADELNQFDDVFYDNTNFTRHFTSGIPNPYDIPDTHFSNSMPNVYNDMPVDVPARFLNGRDIPDFMSYQHYGATELDNINPATSQLNLITDDMFIIDEPYISKPANRKKDRKYCSEV